MWRLAVLLVAMTTADTADATVSVPLGVDDTVTVAVSPLGCDFCPPDATMTGTLPVSLPWNLPTDNCTSSGTASVEVAGGAVQVSLVGTSSGGSCPSAPFVVRVKGPDVSSAINVTVDVPDISEAVTPVIFSLQRSASATPGGPMFRGNGSTADLYESLLLPGDVVVSSHALSLGVPTPARASVEYSFFPGDSILWVWTLEFTAEAIGDFDEAYRLEAFLPPSGPVAKVPMLNRVGRGALAAVLLGVFVFGVRRRDEQVARDRS